MVQRLAHICLWGFALIPLIAAYISLSEDAFSHPGLTLNALGRLAGIFGLSLFLVAAATSFRIPGFDRYFGGLTTLWWTHHQLGGLAFLLLLAHPLLLALGAVPVSLDAAVSTLLPATGGMATWLGWGALLSMMLFLAPSFAFFGAPKYQRWKSLHRLSGVAALLAIAHTLMLARTIPSPWHDLIWFTLIAIAVTSLVYGLVLTRPASQYRYRVTKIDWPANNVIEMSLEPRGRTLSYKAGQFVYLRHEEKVLAGCGEEHPYTLSSSPMDPQLRVAIKDLGDASRAIQGIRPGAEVKLSGPYGAFFPDTVERPELWIAGGIGITPFLSRARHVAKCGGSVDIHLIYCVQDEARALFWDELNSLEKDIAGFSCTLHFYYQHGPLEKDYLRYQCPDMGGREIYICGPAPLLKLATHLLRECGVRHRQLHTEEFNLL